MIKWCSTCVLPNTRPNLKIDIDGICNACKFHKKKKKLINWKKRKQKLLKIFDTVKKKQNKSFDCLIPVSGGKDSIWQVVECLKYGLRPLAVTYKSPGRNYYGEKNLKTLISLGVEHIDYTVNPKIESYFMLKSLKKKGSTGIPMHFSIFNLPLIIAEKFKIPLIIFGENPASEYGFVNKNFERKLNKFDNNWIKKYAPLNQTSLNYWKDKYLKDKVLSSYKIPSNYKNIKILFLGEYIKWSPQKSLKTAKKFGFIYPPKPKTGYYKYADVDCDFISIHHYLKWFKFGFTRLFDNLSIEIRNKNLTRNKAIKIISKSYNNIRPIDDIKIFCKFVNISVKDFDKIVERFRNKEIWKKNKSGKWMIKNFITNKFVWK